LRAEPQNENWLQISMITRGYNMETVTYTEFGKQRKISQPMVSKHIANGTIKKRSLIKFGARYRIIAKYAHDDLDRYYRTGIYEGYTGNLEITSNDELLNLPDFELPEMPELDL
jgi:hypothetical protein